MAVQPLTEVLSSAMASLSLRAPPVPCHTSALRGPASSANLGQSFPGVPLSIQVRWKPILLDVVQTVGGTEPVYSCTETMDHMYQVRVSFSLPLSKSGRTFEIIDVIGTKCCTLSKAETEASAAALQQLQHGCLNILVMDVSRIRSAQLKEKCRRILAEAREMYHGIKSVSLGLETSMDRAERCYRPLQQHGAQSTGHGSLERHGEISSDMAQQLFKIMRANYLAAKEVCCETDELKSNIERAHQCVHYLSVETPAHQVDEKRGSLPTEIKLRMKIVLEEMIMALGWAPPTFSYVRSRPNLYICEACLFLDDEHAGPRCRTLAVSGSEASSIEEALESCCEAAILLMEIEESIYLVDLNYNHRTNGEMFVTQAKEMMQAASSIGARIIGQWELMLKEIEAYEDHCLRAAANFRGEQVGPVQQMWINNAKAVAGLYRSCVADLETAKRHLNKTVRMEQ